MKQTVIGFFDKSSDAQQAVDQLLENGLPIDHIDMSSTSAHSKQGHNRFCIRQR